MGKSLVHYQAVGALRQGRDDGKWLPWKRLLNVAQRFGHAGSDPIELSQRTMSCYADSDHTLPFVLALLIL